ncbi:Aromatic-L-amino-acid decarboxylase [Schistosoma japonicum]|nr:Aromatic-L-amino-acid decarboxylase [Schistosoma japonicum]KAH8872304.1 Aromatic-L-amino-acid decarboxylase [Schistosoma japonicum]
MDWLVHALNLPNKFLSATGKGDPTHTGGGMIELSASMACAVLTMGLRDRMLRNYIKNPQLLTESDYLTGNGPGSLVDRMVAYTSDQAHSSVLRAFRIAMINSRVIKSKLHNQCLVFDPDDLRQEIEKDLMKGFIPLMFADSININAHKMMMVSVESSPLWLSDYRVLTEAFETNPLYLQHTYKGMPDYRKWSLSLARGFRSLKIWFVLRMYGINGLREMTRHHAELAKEFEKLLLNDGRFQITNCVRFGLVCFQLKNDNQLTTALHKELMKKGEIFLVLGCTETNQESKQRKEVEDGEIIENRNELTKVIFLRFVCIHGATMDDIKFAYEKISLAATKNNVSLLFAERKKQLQAKIHEIISKYRNSLSYILMDLLSCCLTFFFEDKLRLTSIQ